MEQEAGMRSNHPRHVEIHLAVPADAAARREALEALLASGRFALSPVAGIARCRARSCWSEWR
ncbi:MAG: hypothetical protein ACLT5P_07730 [Flavonifractor plautii]